jgi:phosphatidylserine decarboxylase
MRLAPYGIREVIISSLCLAATALALSALSPWLVAIPAVVFGWVLYFFRDPIRVIPQGEELVVSPADGQVVDIQEMVEDRFLNEPCVRVGIFLSIFNVHVNRSPIAGIVKDTRYTVGQFFHANSPRATTENEANDVYLHSDRLGLGMVLRQISGQAARRIVCTCKPDDVLEKGEKFGMIKFGSRTELYIPKSRLDSLKIKLRDRVKGGETVLAVLKIGST